MRYRLTLISLSGFLLLFYFPTILHSQNLINDGSFEILKQNATSNDWYPLFYNYHIFQGHLIYFNSKLNNQGYGHVLATYVPNNVLGYQYARSGTGYVATGGCLSGIMVFNLPHSLINGKCYNVRYFVSKAEYYPLVTDAMDGAFAKDSIDLYYLKADTVQPTIKNKNGVISDTCRWVKCEGQYIANGGEKYFALGNFYGSKRLSFHNLILQDSTIVHYSGKDNVNYKPDYSGPGYFTDDVAIWECGTPEYPADAGPDRRICLGEEAEIGAMEARDEYLYLWSERSWHGPRHLWDTLATTPKLTVSPQKTTTYYLWCIDFKFEHTYDSVTVFVENCNIDLEIPNVFTPNGDGFNDYFMINNPDQVNYSLEVFNRWGRQVFVGNQDFFWDGTFNGEPALAGAYFYVLRATTPDGTLSKDFHGSVTILR